MSEFARDNQSELRGLSSLDISSEFAARVSRLADRMDVGQAVDVYAEFKTADAIIEDISIGHLDLLSYISATTPKVFLTEIVVPDVKVFRCQQYEFDFNRKGVQVWFTDYLKAASLEELEDPEFDSSPDEDTGVITLNNVKPRIVTHW